MRSTFVRMTPKPENMVTQKNSNADTQILCAECGWEGSVANPDAARFLFAEHLCRLETMSVSTSD